MSKDIIHFEKFLSNAKKFCIEVGLHEDLLMDIYKADSDWAFILQVDALLETSIKEVLAQILKMDVKGIPCDAEDIKGFIQDLPLTGRTSLTRLLKVAEVPKDFCDFIEAVRSIRNSFAHNIRRVDDSLLTVIDSRNNKNHLLKLFAHRKEYDEDIWVDHIKQDRNILRFAILDLALQFLGVAHRCAF
jgi:hypothetical protein